MFPPGLPEEVVVELLTVELSKNSSPSGWIARLSPGFMMQARRMRSKARGELQVAECTAAT